jgi:uncharacterized membrane protein YbhN (UPF0104 family)
VAGRVGFDRTIERITLRPVHVAAAFVGSVAIVVAAAVPQLYGRQVGKSLGDLGDANRLWLWAAALAFVAMMLCSAAAWRAALNACGGHVGLRRSIGCYGTGSLVNSVAPLRLGDAVRIGLFSRTLDGDGRIWTTGGAFGAVGAARALVLACLVAAAALTGAVPLWPVFTVGAVAAAGIAAALFARNRAPLYRAGHVLDAFRALARDRRAAARLLLFVAASAAARVTAAAAAASSVGISHPFEVALAIVLAVDVAGTLPITPGNIGVASGAIAIALQSHGIGATTALSAGIAFHAVETLVGLCIGALSALSLGSPRTATLRRYALPATVAVASVALAVAFGATVVADLV